MQQVKFRTDTAEHRNIISRELLRQKEDWSSWILIHQVILRVICRLQDWREKVKLLMKNRPRILSWRYPLSNNPPAQSLSPVFFFLFINLSLGKTICYKCNIFKKLKHNRNLIMVDLIYWMSFNGEAFQHTVVLLLVLPSCSVSYMLFTVFFLSIFVIVQMLCSTLEWPL